MCYTGMMDAADVIQNKKIMVYMYSGSSWRRGVGIVFTRERPFKMVDPDLASDLLTNYPEKFRVATEAEIKGFYDIAFTDDANKDDASGQIRRRRL